MKYNLCELYIRKVNKGEYKIRTDDENLFHPIRSFYCLYIIYSLLLSDL